MSAPQNTLPLRSRVVRSMKLYALCSPLTMPADRRRIVAELTAPTRS